MKWETVKLAECCSSIADGDHLPPPKAEKGVPFVTISNINSSHQFDFSDTMYVPQEYYDGLDSKRKARFGDVLYSVVGSFGIPVLIKENTPFVFQRHIGILRPNEKILPAFLYYTMLSRDFYAKADAIAIGAAQRTISLSALRNMEIALPPFEVQKSIVSILSAYDDLIENNQKQIKLLEEAAQRLYKEWFIDLRFPDYENTPIHDGLPEGWEDVPIDAEFSIRYGKNLPTSLISKEGKYPVYGANGIIGFYSEKNCNEHVVLITSRGNGSGDISRTFYKESFVTNNSFIVTGRQPYYGIPFTHQLFMNIDFKSVCTGSAQPQLTNSSISALRVFIPKKCLIEKFNSIAQAWYEQEEKFLKYNICLEEARDRLLPQLMSGELKL